MYKQVLTPDEHNHSIEMPSEFFGKKVEVTVVEINTASAPVYPQPPVGKIISPEQLFECFGEAPDFSSIDKIREKAWPSKW